MDSKFLFSIVGLLLAVVAVGAINKGSKSEIKEGFLNHPKAWKVDRNIASSSQSAAEGNSYSLPNQYAKMAYDLHHVDTMVPQKGDFYQVAPNAQNMLSPRIGNFQVPSQIRYNPPAQEHMGVPADPLTFSNITNGTPQGHAETFVETLGASGSLQACGKGGIGPTVGGGAPPLPPGYTSGNYSQEADKLYAAGQKKHAQATSMIPVGDMTTVGPQGDPINAVVYDRLMYANPNPRLRGRGDPIRGDLAITPCDHGGWFSVSAHPSLDLQQGAMAVMGGIDNSTNQDLAALIYDTSGTTAISGIDMTSQFSSSTSAGLRDLMVTSFP